MFKIFLGIDGGQSHTEAVIADENGTILGRGFGCASNHAEIPGGRERLENAIRNSVGKALKAAGLPPIDKAIFASAHCGMTGGAIYKNEIINSIIKSNNLTVGHDAPTALFGATAGKPGIVVIAGTGSVVFGVNEQNETARAGGLGYLFSDEGSGFWLAAQMIRLAIKEHDGLIEKSGVLEMVLEFFKRAEIRELTDDFYNAKIARDEIASLAKRAHEVAAANNQTIRKEILSGAKILAQSVCRVAEKLNFSENFLVAGVGGMFRSELMNTDFKTSLAAENARGEFVEPRFNPAMGALLLSYKQMKIKITEKLLSGLNNLSDRDESNF